MQRVTPPSDASVELEALVVRALLIKKDGLRIASEQHLEANTRLELLLATEPGARCGVLKEVRTNSAGTFEYASLHRMASQRVRTAETLATHERFRTMSAVVRVIRGLGADEYACRAAGALNAVVLASSLLHAQPAYAWEGDFGEDGSWLRTLCAWYKHRAHSDLIKAKVGRDILLSGVGEALLLLHWADADAAAAKWAAAAADWTAIARDVSASKQTWQAYRNDLPDLRAVRAVALAAGRLGEARKFFACSPEGVAFSTRSALEQLQADPSSSGSAAARACEAACKAADTALAAHAEAMVEYMGRWKMECVWTVGTCALMARAVGTLLIEDDETADAAAEAAADADAGWLPPPSTLLELARAETAWDVYPNGAQHPALAAALVYARGRRWAEARWVAEGLLVELTQPLARFEAHCLLARCEAADDAAASVAAGEAHLRAAADEAAAAGYLWLRLLALRALAEVQSGATAAHAQADDEAEELASQLGGGASHAWGARVGEWRRRFGGV